MSRYRVPALEKALIIIEALAESDKPMRISELSSLYDIPKTTVLMILTTLEEYGYVDKSEDGKYKLTTKILNLGSAGQTLKRLARKYLEGLKEELKFTVHLSVLKNNENVLLDKVSGPGFIQFSTFEGKRQSFHATSSGKAMLAYMDDQKINHIFPEQSLPTYTPNTISTLPQLMASLSVVKENGYAIEDEEEESGIRCIGAPIFNVMGEVTAAVSVTAVRSELSLASCQPVAEKIKQTAFDISYELGWKGHGFYNKSTKFKEEIK